VALTSSSDPDGAVSTSSTLSRDIFFFSLYISVCDLTKKNFKKNKQLFNSILDFYHFVGRPAAISQFFFTILKNRENTLPNLVLQHFQATFFGIFVQP
jgi:hypothetical protein